MPGQTEANRKYAEDYKKEYNEQYDGLSAWTYDGLKILVNAIEKLERIVSRSGRPSWPSKGTRASWALSPLPRNGDGLHEVSVVQIERGTPQLLKIVNVGAK